MGTFVALDSRVSRATTSSRPLPVARDVRQMVVVASAELDVEPLRPPQAPSRRDLLVTYVLLCLAIMVDKADVALLPAVFLEVCTEFDTGPKMLGTVTLCRGMAQALVALAAGPIGGRHDRIRVAAWGVAAWAGATALVGAAPSVGVLLFARALNGLGLGLVIPIIFSLVSDMTGEGERGRAFGVLSFTANLGGAFGSLFATNLAAGTLLGVAGWRAAFYVVAAISLGVAALLYAFGVEPRPRAASAAPLRLKQIASENYGVLRLRTFQVIIAQGAVGTAPWFALGFLTLYLEQRGLSHAAAAGTVLLFNLGTTGGTLLGGVLADAAARWSPGHGRVAVAQVSAGSGVPLFLLVLLGLPAADAGPGAYGAVLLLAGLLIAWCQAVNNTIMAEITPPQLRPTIYGLDRLLEGLVSPAGAAAAGALTEAFGFSHSGGCGAGGGGAQLRSNADALGAALAW